MGWRKKPFRVEEWVAGKLNFAHRTNRAKAVR